MDRYTLEQAIIKGAATKDFFGTAYRQSGDDFEGFRFGDANVQLDDTLLLIESEAAKKYEAKLLASLTASSGGATGSTPPPTTEPGTHTLFDPPATNTGHAATTPVGKTKSFYGSVDVNPSTAKMRLVQLAEEIINHLASDSQADLKITVEINADFPHGASDQIKRAVSQNAKSLGFKIWTWE